MVVIRFARTGKKKQAFYRVVVADSKRAVTAKFISIVGWYNPHTKEVNLKTEEIQDWLKKGAVPSNSAAVLMKKEGIKLPDWVEIKEKVRKPKKEVVEEPKKEAPKAEEPAAEATEEATTETVEETVETEAPAEVAEEAAPVEAEAPTEE